MDEDFLKSEDYRKWREQVNERLASLTTDTMMSQDRLDEIDQHIKVFDDLLEGKPTDKNDNGLKGDIHDMGTRVNRLWAVIFTDEAGNKGMFEDFKNWQRGEHRWEVSRTNLTAIVVAAISTAGLLLSQWPRIQQAFFKESAPQTHSGKIIKRGRHPKKYKVPVDESTASQDVPDVPSNGDDSGAR